MSSVRPQRRRSISQEGKLRLVRAIQALPANTSLTWHHIQDLASEHAGGGYRWTRQALERHVEIKGAYLAHETARRKLSKGGSVSGRHLTESQKIARLEQEAERLRATLNQYDQRFATYLANAVAHGMTVQQLSAPLLPPSRGQGNSDAT